MVTDVEEQVHNIAGSEANEGMDIFAIGLCLSSDNKTTVGQQDRIIEEIEVSF